MKTKILLAEDDGNLGFVTKDSLEQLGYQVDWCQDGLEALNFLRNGSYDIALLDVMMPKMDGFELAQIIRKDNKQIPIIFLTAKSMQEDVLTGFELGADDYICKPFSIQELSYRINVFIKRTTTNSPPKKVSIGTFQFDFDNLSLQQEAGDEKRLTYKEAVLLRLLIENKNSVLKRKDILIKIWGEDDYFLGRSLDVFISKLRKYLKPDERISILNVHGVGFEFKILE